MNTNNKVAVITGTSRGLGAGIAEHFRERGIKLGLCSRGKPVLDPSDQVVAMQVDVTDQEAVSGFTAAVEQRFGQIHLWINNAGVLEPIAPLRDCTSKQFRTHLDINVVGVFHGTKAYVRHLRARDARGTLINISSGAAWNGYAGWSAYCAGKAAVDLMTESVQLEEADFLKAYAVAPGVIDTQMQELIRQCDHQRFPMVDKFIELKKNNAFNTPDFVAERLAEIAFDPSKQPDKVRIELPRQDR